MTVAIGPFTITVTPVGEAPNAERELVAAIAAGYVIAKKKVFP